MIIKKIRRKTPARATAGSEFAYVARLTRYVVRADPADLRKLALHEENAHVHDLLTYVDKEEVIAAGAINLLGKALEHQQVEMQALRRRDPEQAMALWAIYTNGFCRKPEARALMAAFRAWHTIERVRPLPF